MKTFLVVDREIPSDAKNAAAILEKALKNANSIVARTPKDAAKQFYLKARQETHRIGRGHRNPPYRVSQIKVADKLAIGRFGSRTAVRFTVGQIRRDGVLTHFDDLTVVGDDTATE